jgi:uncharacterized peroxidase-related enzyme
LLLDPIRVAFYAVYRKNESAAWGNKMDDITRHSTSRISRLKVPEAHELDADIAGIYAQNERQHGYVENWLQSLALNPATLKRSMAFFESMFNPANSTIAASEREMIAVVVSADNGCTYCEAHHTKGLATELKDSLKARRIALGWDHVPDLSLREQGIAEMAIKVTRQPKAVNDQDMQKLRDLGLRDEEILEVIETAAFFNFTNRLAISLGNVPEDALFDL